MRRKRRRVWSGATRKVTGRASGGWRRWCPAALARSPRPASALSHVRPRHLRTPPARFGAPGALGRAGVPAAGVRVGEPGLAAGQRLASSAVRRARSGGRGPEGEPEGCGGDISVLRVARRAVLCCTQHLENTALVKLLVSFKKCFIGV